MQYLLRFLLAPSMALWKYCLCLVPLAIVPSVLLSILAILLADAVGVDVAAHSAPARDATFRSFMGAVVFAPIVETLILSWLLKVLLSTSLSIVESAVVSAGLWGLFHGMFGALWFFGTVWSFFVFSCGYIVWCRASYWHGFLAASIPHALVNSMMLLFILIRETVVKSAT
jgi:hypothetical protein